MLEWKHVTGTSRKFHLKDITFTLEPGYLYGLMGKNGAGKTTLLRYLLEEKIPYEGSILYNGRDIRKEHKWFLGQTGYVADENPFFSHHTGAQNACMMGPFYEAWSEKRFREAMKRMDCDVRQIVGNMSRGEFIRFQLAFAYGHQAGIYLMDEATAGMDPVFRREFFNLVRELLEREEVTVLMTTHLQSDADRNMDYVGLLQEGRLVSFRENIS